MMRRNLHFIRTVSPINLTKQRILTCKIPKLSYRTNSVWHDHIHISIPVEIVCNMRATHYNNNSIEVCTCSMLAKVKYGFKDTYTETTIFYDETYRLIFKIYLISLNIWVKNHRYLTLLTLLINAVNENMKHEVFHHNFNIQLSYKLKTKRTESEFSYTYLQMTTIYFLHSKLLYLILERITLSPIMYFKHFITALLFAHKNISFKFTALNHLKNLLITQECKTTIESIEQLCQTPISISVEISCVLTTAHTQKNENHVCIYSMVTESKHGFRSAYTQIKTIFLKLMQCFIDHIINYLFIFHHYTNHLRCLIILITYASNYYVFLPLFIYEIKFFSHKTKDRNSDVYCRSSISIYVEFRCVMKVNTATNIQCVCICSMLSESKYSFSNTYTYNNKIMKGTGCYNKNVSEIKILKYII